ncbi:MAG TPA: S-methyl-5-thioribose-1-phosphate isomerase [Thermoguttaceae bacterium]|nr:S-methyl-5-thioribose-1-phosphate isomerase [Thermoguttaceae bacterium]HPP52773.1 S-methyl-5-thioribose-1-phosphate isomerase [Thermoguttaceae bacterium]
MHKVIQHVETLRWCGGPDGYLELVDQTLLPTEFRYLTCRDLETLCEAIRQLRVRGAPAIGIAAAYGVVLGLQQATGPLHPPLVSQKNSVEKSVQPAKAAFGPRLEEVIGALASTRPTAVNLFWALERMRRRALALQDQPIPVILESLLQEAKAIHEEDRQMCRAIGRHGQELLSDGQSVLTHCNAGGLATADYGTALAVIYAAVEAGKRIHVYVDETRPLWQGARLTAWELQQRSIPATVLCDNAAASLLQQGRVQAVITGADRIAANGDVANKIGTYGLAVLAAAHNIPFYVAAPSSTFDLAIADGSQIPIEHRPGREVTHPLGRPIAPEGVEVYNPAFDVTTARLVTAIICERGVIRPVCRAEIAACLGES